MWVYAEKAANRICRWGHNYQLFGIAVLISRMSRFSFRSAVNASSKSHKGSGQSFCCFKLSPVFSSTFGTLIFLAYKMTDIGGRIVGLEASEPSGRKLSTFGWTPVLMKPDEPRPNFQFHASQSPWYATRGRCSRRQGCHLRLLSHLPHPQRRRSRGGRFLQHRLGGMEEQCRKTLDEVKEKKEAGSQIGVQLAELIGQNRGFKRP